MNRLNQKRCDYCYIYPCDCDDYNNQEGGFLPLLGLAVGTKFLADWLLKKRPKPIKKWLKINGDKKITNLQVCRIPVTSALKNVINVASLGTLKKRIKNKPYDELYHLFLLITLDDGSTWRLEKNQRVMVSRINRTRTDQECEQRMRYNKKTLRQFFDDAEKKADKNFYQYDAFVNNCQKFLYDLLNANGITQYNDFIKQDTHDLAPGYVKSISKGITNVSGLADLVLHGGNYKNN